MNNDYSILIKGKDDYTDEYEVGMDERNLWIVSKNTESIALNKEQVLALIKALVEYLQVDE